MYNNRSVVGICVTYLRIVSFFSNTRLDMEEMSCFSKVELYLTMNFSDTTNRDIFIHFYLFLDNIYVYKFF